LLYFTLVYTFNRLGWQGSIPAIDEVKYKKMAFRLQNSYRNNFYHTQIHAADVVQNLVFLIERCDVKELCKMTANDIFFTLISGAAHDMDHPGTNNMYEIKCKSKLATLYNDQAVLENHHAASFFFLLENEELNCIRNMSPKEKADGRKMILDNILGTDMSKHSII
jgi:hypothetical protein